MEGAGSRRITQESCPLYPADQFAPREDLDPKPDQAGIKNKEDASDDKGDKR